MTPYRTRHSSIARSWGQSPDQPTYSMSYVVSRRRWGPGVCKGRQALLRLHHRNEIAQQRDFFLIIPELLCGIYTLLSSRRTLRRVELWQRPREVRLAVLGVVVESLSYSSINNSRNFHFAKFVYGYQRGMGSWFLSKRHFS